MRSHLLKTSPLGKQRFRNSQTFAKLYSPLVAKLYSPLVHNDIAAQIHSTIETIANSMINQATLESADYLTQRDEFLRTIDTHIEEANIWTPTIVCILR